MEIEGVIKGWGSDIPVRRMVDPNEIAEIVAFLVSERASYVIGAAVQVDGGLIKTIL